MTATARWRHCVVRAALATFVVLAAACSDEPNRADEDRPTSTDRVESDTSGPTTTLDERSQAVVDGLDAAGDAFNEAAGGPDPDYPLDETHVGPMLNQSRNIVEGLAADGLVLEYPEDSRSSETVLSVDFRSDSVAILEVCAVDDGRRVDQETGEVVAGGGVSTVWSDVAMELHGDTWKLAEVNQTDRKDGAASCDPAG